VHRCRLTSSPSPARVYSLSPPALLLRVSLPGPFFFELSRDHRDLHSFPTRRSSDLLIKERILVIILLLHFLSLMLGSVLVLMLPLLVWLTPDLRIKKSLLKCNWTIRKRLPRCKMRLKKRLLAFSRRLHAR